MKRTLWIPEKDIQSFEDGNKIWASLQKKTGSVEREYSWYWFCSQFGFMVEVKKTPFIMIDSQVRTRYAVPGKFEEGQLGIITAEFLNKHPYVKEFIVLFEDGHKESFLQFEFHMLFELI